MGRIALAWALLLPAPPGTTRRVPADYATLQAALDAAADGDTVRVERGTYAGPFRLAKTLTLMAAEEVVLDGGAPILTVTSSAGPGTRIQGFTFRGGGKALVIDGARKVDVLDCRFADNGGDQLSFENAGGTVRNCFFQNAGDDNIDIDGASDPLVEHNTLIGAADDNIEMRFQPYVKAETLKPVIRHNYLSGAKGGDGIQLIDYKGTSNRTLRIERNVITNARWAGIGSMEDAHTKQSDFPDAPRGSPQVEKIYVIHNTLVENGWGVTGGRAMLLLNNLIVESKGPAIRRVKGASAIRNNGLWKNGADYDDSVAPEGDLARAPELDATLRLQEGSPCVDAGLASVVWNGETVAAGEFSGKAPDLGAFEHSGEGMPVVTVTASDPKAAEPSDPGAFTLSRSGPLKEGLTVTIAVGGSAAPGADYEALAVEVTIPAGAASAVVTVTPKDDAEAEGPETVELRLRPGAAYAPGSPSAAALTIADNDGKLPVVSIAATEATAAERGAKPGVFTITRTGSLKAALTVKFEISGEAVNGVDYEAIRTSLTLPAGEARATLRIVPIDDREADEEEVTLTLLPSSGYVLGARAGATLTIDDDD